METRLGMVEERFAQLMWDNVPMTTREMVVLAEKELNWKRTTTYTVLKKLCDRGIFEMKDRTVTALLSQEEFRAVRGEQFVQHNYNGSLPAFIAAFTSRNKVTKEEMDEIKKLIDAFEE